MKNLFLLLIANALFLSTYAGPMYGVIETYEDFKNGKVIACRENEFSTYGLGKDATVVIKQKGKETEYKMYKIYGYLDKGDFYRICPLGSLPGVKMVMVGEYVMYMGWSGGSSVDAQGRSNFSSSKLPLYYVSKGHDGKLHYVLGVSSNIDKIGQEDPKMLPLAQGVKKLKGNILVRISKYIQTSPGYVEQVSEAIPSNKPQEEEK